MRAVYKVFSDGDRWVIKREGAYTPVAVLDRKNDAVKAARDMAERDLPSRLVVYDAHGGVESDRTLGVDQLQQDIEGMRALEEPLPEGMEPMPEMEDEPG
jgi:hypothetical protein